MAFGAKLLYIHRPFGQVDIPKRAPSFDKHKIFNRFLKNVIEAYGWKVDKSCEFIKRMIENKFEEIEF